MPNTLILILPNTAQRITGSIHNSITLVPKRPWLYICAGGHYTGSWFPHCTRGRHRAPRVIGHVPSLELWLKFATNFKPLLREGSKRTPDGEHVHRAMRNSHSISPPPYRQEVTIVGDRGRTGSRTPSALQSLARGSLSLPVSSQKYIPGSRDHEVWGYTTALRMSVSGSMRLTLDEDSETAYSNDCCRCPQGHRHQLALTCPTLLSDKGIRTLLYAIRNRNKRAAPRDGCACGAGTDRGCESAGQHAEKTQRSPSIDRVGDVHGCNHNH